MATVNLLPPMSNLAKLHYWYNLPVKNKLFLIYALTRALKDIKSNLRPFSLTRSNFIGTGHYAVHWLGDNDSTWKHMKMSIIGILEYNFFGIPMVGADICGFFIDVRDAEMCTRWLQLGSFYTFTRSHNANNQRDKDPASFKNKLLEDSTRDVLKIRYSLLPYVYTKFYLINQNGGTFLRPLFFEFPTDINTLKIDEQFFFGESLLVSPVLNQVKFFIKSKKYKLSKIILKFNLIIIIGCS